jgi:hypothetical protein
MADENISKDRIKRSAKNPHEEDKQLTDSFSEAQHLELEKTKENNHHERKKLGLIGAVFGYEKVASVNIAATFAVICLLISVGCLIGGYWLDMRCNLNDHIYSENLYKFSERFLGASLAALSYIFGKGGR